MPDIADLELGLHKREAGKFTVEMRFSQPGSDDDKRIGLARPIIAQIDLQDLLSKADNPAAYGASLARGLFADKDVLAEFAKARASAQTSRVPLRVRLLLGPTASELNTLYWECLRDPDDDKATLFTGEQVFFSRYLSSVDERSIKLRAKGNLKALVVISNPSNLKDYPALGKVDVAGELERARNSLRGIPITSLPSTPEANEYATLNAIIDSVRQGVDILYLVAHGAFVNQQPWLFLQDENGAVARVSGYDLATRIRELENQPRLVVLASCQSAGAGAEAARPSPGPKPEEGGAGAALQSLGPKLAEGGVPAVLAMQGSVSMDTVAKFMPVFFQELQKDGQIDRAMSVARGMVRNQSDFWMPVLFMRLKSGRLWVSSEQLASQGIEGIKATAAILRRSSELYARTVKSFEIASEQIGRMANYKRLHDLLHRLQFEIYAPASAHVARFPDDPDATDELLVYAEKLDTMVKDLNELLANPAINTREKNLTRDFEAALRDFNQALAANDATLLRKCFSSLKRVIATRPTVVNGVLTEAARALQLNVLGDALGEIAGEAQEGNLDTAYLGQIRDAADAILALDRSLTALVNEHDAWQDVSIDLRDFEEDPKRFDESQREELGFRWSDLKEKAQPLYMDRTEDWAVKMRDAAVALDSGLAAGNPTDMRRAFRKFSTVAGDRFFKVDCNLKDLCDDIDKISEPLQKVIESVGRTDE